MFLSETYSRKCNEIVEGNNWKMKLKHDDEFMWMRLQ
jgi:hypothetical protein